MPYYKTTYTFEVLSDQPLKSWISLEELHNITYDGDCSGQFIDSKTEELTTEEMIKACHEHGTDPEFFMINICSECEDPDCPGVIVCPECGIGEHGVEAETHIQDHGHCWNCHKRWQMGETDEES